MQRLAGVLLSLALLCAATLSPAVAEEKTLTVFAAASMKNALDDIDAAFTAKTGVPLAAIAAAAWSCVEKILQEDQRTSPPSACKLSISTAV